MCSVHVLFRVVSVQTIDCMDNPRFMSTESLDETRSSGTDNGHRHWPIERQYSTKSCSKTREPFSSFQPAACHGWNSCHQPSEGRCLLRLTAVLQGHGDCTVSPVTTQQTHISYKFMLSSKTERRAPLLLIIIITELFLKAFRFSVHSAGHGLSALCCVSLMKWVTVVLWSVGRMKGEENSVLRDYVLPDFSSIKKGFCKVRKHFPVFELWLHKNPVRWLIERTRLLSSLFFLFGSISHETKWSSVESTRQESRSWGWPMSALLSQRCSSTRQTSASKRWASQRPLWTPSSPCQKVRRRTLPALQIQQWAHSHTCLVYGCRWKVETDRLPHSYWREI